MQTVDIQPNKNFSVTTDGQTAEYEYSMVSEWNFKNMELTKKNRFHILNGVGRVKHVQYNVKYFTIDYECGNLQLKTFKFPWSAVKGFYLEKDNLKFPFLNGVAVICRHYVTFENEVVSKKEMTERIFAPDSVVAHITYHDFYIEDLLVTRNHKNRIAEYTAKTNDLNAALSDFIHIMSAHSRELIGFAMTIKAHYNSGINIGFAHVVNENVHTFTDAFGTNTLKIILQK